MHFFTANSGPWTPTPEFWTLLTFIATGIGHWIWQVTKDRKARADLDAANRLRLQEREEDRKDLIAAAEAAAALNSEQLKPVIEQLEAIDKGGHERLKMLLNSNVTTRGLVKDYAKKADVAIETSNGIKKDLRENGVKLITSDEQ